MYFVKSRPIGDDEQPKPKPKARATTGKQNGSAAAFSAVTWAAINTLIDALGDSIGKVIAEERRQTQAVITSLQNHVAELERNQVKFVGPWRQGGSYAKNSICSRGGSAWFATRQYPGKPGEPRSGWQLFIKRGRDGKDAR